MTSDTFLYESNKVWDQALQKGQKNLAQAIIDFFPASVKTAIDIGCGDGKLTQAIINQTACDMVGLDCSQEALSRCCFKTIQAHATQLPFQEAQFDLVLTADMLEHLSDHDEKKAWGELFRITRQWLFVAVPFREQLLEATARCHHCQKLYHVNWHQRAYDWPALIKQTPENFVVESIILTGEPWSPYHRIETQYRRHVLDEWSGWKESFCPHCKKEGTDPDPIQPLPQSIVTALGDRIYAELKNKPSYRQHSEILIIYRHKNVLEKSFLKSNKIFSEGNSNKIEFPSRYCAENLIPYPAFARIICSQGDDRVLQFPAYSPYTQLIIKHAVIEKSNQIEIIVEDGKGLVYQGVLKTHGGKSIISLPRETCCSYYGIIARLKTTVSLYSIQLGEGIAITEFRDAFQEGCHYHHINLGNHNAYLQLTEPFYFERTALNTPFFDEDVKKQKHVVMLCHDQHLDRRVIAQASSLIDLGIKVTLIALSYDSEDKTEYLPEGLRVERIGLKKVIPHNKIYQFYIKQQNFLQSVLNKLCNYLPGKRMWRFGFYVFSRLNRMLYKLLLLLRYHNLKISDPLPFRQAFCGAASAFIPDLIQVHDLPALEAGVEIARQMKIPLIYDAHELYPEQRSFSFVQRRLCTKQENRLIKFCTKVFTVNDSIANEMARRYHISRPITLLNALDPPSTFDSNRPYNLLREKLNLPITRKILLFQGGFSRHRNLENLIKAMKILKNPDIDLVMMGFGDYGAILQALAQKLRLLNKRVYFLPAVSQAELLSYTASADLGIIPYPHVDLNSYYCTPNKLFEFIQARLPILANDSPELRRFVQNEGFGMVHAMRSKYEIAEAIDEAFEKKQNQRWKENLSQQQARFSWEKNKGIYLQAIQEEIRSCAE